ncbi:MAG: photosystem I reaction center subunit VIII [Cyanobacteria bacterium J06621_8]
MIGDYSAVGDFALSWLPAALVPLVGVVGAGVSMALLFLYIESDA